MQYFWNGKVLAKNSPNVLAQFSTAAFGAVDAFVHPNGVHSPENEEKLRQVSILERILELNDDHQDYRSLTLEENAGADLRPFFDSASTEDEEEEEEENQSNAQQSVDNGDDDDDNDDDGNSVEHQQDEDDESSDRPEDSDQSQVDLS